MPDLLRSNFTPPNKVRLRKSKPNLVKWQTKTSDKNQCQRPYRLVLGSINPSSPSADKKWRQRLKKSPEAKEAQKEKNKFAMQKRRELETKEQKALTKNKHREKQRLIKKKKMAGRDWWANWIAKGKWQIWKEEKTAIRDWGGNKIAQGKCKTQDEEESFRWEWGANKIAQRQ
jgi:hypothetical protein